MSDRRRIYLLIPLIVFLGLALILLARIKTSVDPSAIPSALLGKPVPAFELTALRAADHSPIDTGIFTGKVSVVNFWASWCLPCRQEHPLLMVMAKDTRFQIIGINYKDKPEKAQKFLDELGDPYTIIATDPAGRTGIDFGVYGIPETFVVDSAGTIAFKWIGPITPQIWAQYLKPEIEKALDQLDG